MKILIATGIFPPDIGGPATYTLGLASRLGAAGEEVTVVTYSSIYSDVSDSEYPFRLVRVRRGNRVLNRVRFFFIVLRQALGYDIIYTLDWFAAGLPVALVAKLLRKPYLVRVGGDYLWEQRYLESGNKPIPLSDFYADGMHTRKEYKFFFRIIRWVLNGARYVIFNSDRQRELYMRFYGLLPVRTKTIFNPVPKIQPAGEIGALRTDEFVYWGRFIVMKNIDSLIRAFAKAEIPHRFTLALIGDGPQKKYLVSLVRKLGIGDRVGFESPLPNSSVPKRVGNCRALILPSWTDISPNQVVEALALGLPALVTQENYLSARDQLPQMIDPHSIEDITTKIEILADDVGYTDFSNRWSAIKFNQTWDDVLKQNEALFNDIVGK